MGYLDILRNDAKLAEDFDALFDFRLLDALEERDTAEGRCTFSVPGMAFAVDGDYRCPALYPPCFRHHRNTFSDEYLVGISRSSRMLAVGLLSAVLAVGQRAERVSVLTERGGTRAIKVGSLGRSLSGGTGQCSAVAGSYFCGALGE